MIVLYTLSWMPFHTQIQNPIALQKILENNPSWVILKFTATWCGPCKKIEPLISERLQQLSQGNVQIYILDIDDNFEMYGYMKSKRRVNGVPTMLAYKRGNLEITPDLAVSGTKPSDLDNFFAAIQ